MDKKTDILLGSEKNIVSVNRDSYDKIELTTNKSELMEFNINDVVDSTLVFDAERQNNANYRIYGRIEYMSLLNGVKNGSRELIDFFNPQVTGDSKNLLNSFDFYMVAPHPTDAYGNVRSTGGTQKRRNFIVLADKTNIEIYNAGFTNNVYGEQSYAFSFKWDFDVTDMVDYLGFPITELFLYVQYKKKSNESMSRKTFYRSGNITKTSLTTKDLEVGDDVENSVGSNIQDVIEYIKDEFYQALYIPQTYYIRTPYGSNELEWSYNPFIPFRLRYFSEDVNYANTGSTSYDVVNSIPDYATKLDNDGNYVWRDIDAQGYADPLTGVGVDYPFLNKRRYLFEPITFSVIPNLDEDTRFDHPNTLTVFSEIAFSENADTIDYQPEVDLNTNTEGKPCQ